MATPSRGLWSLWLRFLQLLTVVALAWFAYQVSRPAPEVSVTVHGKTLFVRYRAPLEGTTLTARVGDQSRRLEPVSGGPMDLWRCPIPLLESPREVVLTLPEGEVSLGDLYAEGDPVRILGPAADRQVRIEAVRPLSLWWESRPEHRAQVAPGPSTLEGPAEGLKKWRLRYAGEFEEGSLTVDPGPLLRAWIRRSESIVDAASRLSPLPLPTRKARSLAENPTPVDPFRGWRGEFLEHSNSPTTTRKMWNVRSDETLLTMLHQKPSDCSKNRSPSDPGRWPHRSAREPPRTGAVPVPERVPDKAPALLMNQVVTLTIQPPGRLAFPAQELVWPDEMPSGPGSLRLVVPLENGRRHWVRLWEVRFGGEGFRVVFPPDPCEQDSLEWLVWTIPKRVVPESKTIVFLEVWRPPGVAPGLEAPVVGEVELVRTESRAGL